MTPNEIETLHLLIHVVLPRVAGFVLFALAPMIPAWIFGMWQRRRGQS